MTDTLVLALLALAIFWFWASTRQFLILIRLVLLLLGATCVGLAVDRFAAAHPEILALAIASIRAAKYPILWALSGNIDVVDAALSQFAIVVGVMVTALGFVALIALTPGERVERVVRTLLYGLVGAMVGGVLALSHVAIGFGGAVKRQVYVQLFNNQTMGSDAEVIDVERL